MIVRSAIEPLEARIAPASIALGTGTTNSNDVVLASADTLSSTIDATLGLNGKLVVTGTVTLTGASLDLTVLSLPGAFGAHPYTLVDNDGTDAIAGTFSGLPEGALFDADGGIFRISYVGGDGNDLTVTALLPKVQINEGSKSVTFTDTDGDIVTIKTNKGTFVRSQFLLVPVDEQFERAQLARLVLNASFNGANISITSTAAGGGDGFVDVGAVKATGLSLGTVVIDGDIGQIDAGATTQKIAIASLTVGSIGKRGTTTQFTPSVVTTESPAPELISTITGELTTLKVLGDVKDARVKIVTGSASASPARLGSLTIGGSLIGRAAAETASDDTGTIECDRGIGAVKIGTTTSDGIFGGGGKNSGRIRAGAGIASVTISGGIVGGAGVNSGAITSLNTIGPVVIGGDLAGGAGDGSGLVQTSGNLTSLTIGDDLVAGTGIGSGVVSVLGAISKLIVTGDIDGTTTNAGAGSARIFANGLPLATINGNVLGGSADGTGLIESGRAIGAMTATKTTGLTILGNVVGGDGDGSGAIVAGSAVWLATIKGNLTGGLGSLSGVVRSGTDTALNGEMRTVTIAGAVSGGAGDSSGAIIAGGNLGTAKLGNVAAPTADALKGGGGAFSGSISANGKIATVKITGNVLGGVGAKSGSVLCYERSAAEGDLPGSIGTITISGGLTGGDGTNSGLIHADGGLNALTVASWTGGAGVGSGSLVTGAGLFGAGDVGVIRILGDVATAPANGGAGSVDFLIGGRLKTWFVGDDTTGATLRVIEDAATLTFTGDVTDTKVTALGQEVHTATANIAIGRLGIGGNVSGSDFLAGYDLSGAAANPDAQIGAVSVAGNWTASNLVAGVAEGADAGFGNPLDVKAPGEDIATIVSKIASVVINGSVSGAAGENFGFVAQLVAKMKVGTTVFALNTLADAQTFEVGGAGSGVAIREVAV